MTEEWQQMSDEPPNINANTDVSNKEQNALNWVYMQIIQQNK